MKIKLCKGTGESLEFVMAHFLYNDWVLHIHDLKSVNIQFNFYLLFTVFKYCNSWLLPKWGYNIIADVRTQAMYQMMDEGFIGLIFSVFNEDKSTKVSWW